MEKVTDFLENGYRWSSFWDYIGKLNFVSVTSRKFLLQLVTKEAMKEEVNFWINYKAELGKAIEAYNTLFLE